METKKFYIKNVAYDLAVTDHQGDYYLLQFIRCTDGKIKNVHVKVMHSYKQSTTTGMILIIAGMRYAVCVRQDGYVIVLCNNKLHSVSVNYSNEAVLPATLAWTIEPPFGLLEENKQQLSGKQLLVSPLAGRVISLLVEVGQRVQKGQPLIIVESMKMENELCASYNAIIKTLFILPGDLVQPKQELIMFDLEE